MFPSPLRHAPLAIGLAVVLGLAACSGTTKDSTADDSKASGASAKADPTAPLKKDLKIAFLPKQLNNPYSDIEVGGGETAIKEIGGAYKLVGPNDANASSQVSYINTLIQQQQNVIAVAANDPNAVCPSLNQARKAGIKVVAFDSDASKDCRDLFMNQASTQGVGDSLVAMASELAGGSGEVAILSATPNATNQNAWIDVVKADLKKPENSKLKLVKIAYGNDEPQKSFQEAQGLLQTYPKLKVIISPTTVGIKAAAQYISSSNYKDKVAITGLGTPNDMRKYIKDGTVKQFALWSPADLGYLTAFAGAALASGQITGAEGDKFKAGKLGDYTVGKDGEVVLGPPTVFTLKNIDDFNF
jgi:rhamnose transport system substrate-binding protein